MRCLIYFYVISEEITFREKITSAIFGFSVADAPGVPFENLSREDLKNQLV